MDFTYAQQKAICCRGSSVLVSAGAGSGKTRVLTERLMEYMDPQHSDAQPEDIDRFLPEADFVACALPATKETYHSWSSPLPVLPPANSVRVSPMRSPPVFAAIRTTRICAVRSCSAATPRSGRSIPSAPQSCANTPAYSESLLPFGFWKRIRANACEPQLWSGCWTAATKPGRKTS